MADEIEVKKYSHFLHVAREEMDDRLPSFVDMLKGLEEEQRRFNALPAEEQARILAERAAADTAAKAERTCPHCGCDPDEHGGY